MTAARSQRSPALAASVLAHLALVAAALIGLPHASKPFKLGEAVPVTIVANGPAAELAPAVQAPEPAPATTPEPTPDAPVPPAPVSPAPPAPTPPKAQAKPPPAPSPVAKPAPPEPNFLDSLAASLAKPKPASGQHGPSRPRAAPEAQTGQGQDDHVSAAEFGALKAKLIKLWNPNCQIEGANKIIVPVRIRLTPDGRLSAPAEDVNNLRNNGNPVIAAAAQRAVSAVGRGAPYTELNPEHYEGWRDIIVNFDAGKACANR